MSYDARAESIALIAAGRAEPVRRLSRRRRFAAMAVDVAGDIAVTVFARRGVGCVWEDNHVFVFRDHRWQYLGGGSSGSDGSGVTADELLADRPQQLPEMCGNAAAPGTDADVMVDDASGGVSDDGGRDSWWPWHGRWIGYTILRVSARVTRVRADDRALHVPWHGRIPVVWAGRRPPRLAAYDELGQRRDLVVPPTRW